MPAPPSDEPNATHVEHINGWTDNPADIPGLGRSTLDSPVRQRRVKERAYILMADAFISSVYIASPAIVVIRPDEAGPHMIPAEGRGEE